MLNLITIQQTAVEDQRLVSACAVLAGKDRTGVESALLLSLAGVPDELIVRDYALTRVDIETEKECLLPSLQQAWPECDAGAVWFKECPDTKASYMMAFLEAVKV
jgi:protein tyrosine/serine phosphatase